MTASITHGRARRYIALASRKVIVSLPSKRRVLRFPQSQMEALAHDMPPRLRTQGKAAMMGRSGGEPDRAIVRGAQMES